jgi:CRP/FNR family transcriptional regulator, cyclic AMP receptor protein
MTLFNIPLGHAHAFLLKAGLKPKIVEVHKKQIIFAQGDAGNAVFYIQEGCVKFSVASKQGKHATIALLGPGDFLGEGCIAVIEPRLGSATAITACTLLRMKRNEIQRAIRQKHRFSETLITYLLAYITQIHDDLTDQVFSPSEKRLARTLLSLSRFQGNGNSDGLVPKISQQVLAEMVGTTRSRVSFFMNRFRKLGFIDYNGTLRVHKLPLSRMCRSLVTKSLKS